ncbi:hypothetical protein ACFFX0_07790 [Citricoccus parietis]|uniref:Uncharacterized protein n=1 Tax=Citricoccus parietis TaxID=592307 RepID=A0ABV5FXZ3_9MICC
MPVSSLNWVLAPSAIRRRFRIHSVSFRAYSGSFSGPRMSTASRARMISSAPLIPKVTRPQPTRAAGRRRRWSGRPSCARPSSARAELGSGHRVPSSYSSIQGRSRSKPRARRSAGRSGPSPDWTRDCSEMTTRVITRSARSTGRSESTV